MQSNQRNGFGCLQSVERYVFQLSLKHEVLSSTKRLALLHFFNILYCTYCTLDYTLKCDIRIGREHTHFSFSPPVPPRLRSRRCHILHRRQQIR